MPRIWRTSAHVEYPPTDASGSWLGRTGIAAILSATPRPPSRRIIPRPEGRFASKCGACQAVCGVEAPNLSLVGSIDFAADLYGADAYKR